MTGAEAAGRGATILIVEDSATEAEQLSLGLEARGYRVTTARDGAEGLRQARALRPALVISDVVMPAMDGYAMCQAIKADHEIAQTPVILVTALSSPADVIRGLECGADHFVRKPYDLDYLAGRITDLLANRELRAQDGSRAVEDADAGVELEFDGHRHVIRCERRQILSLLVSTYDQAVQVNGELQSKERELRRSYDAIDNLYRLASSLNAAGTEAAVLDAALEHALQLPQVTGGWIWLLDGQGRFRCAASRGVPAGLLAEGTSTVGCECQRGAVSSGLVRAANITDCPRAPSRDRAASTHVSVPLRQSDRIVGVVNLPVQAPLEPDALAILDGMVMQAGVALARVRLQDELQASNSELQSFVHSVSHDLRTPLGILSGFAAVLDEHRDGMDEQAIRCVAQIRKYAERMNRLFEDLIAFSRMGRAEIHAHTVDLNAVVARVRDELAPMWRDRAVAWSVGPLPTVEGDPALLGVVFDNLLTNAIKFTRPRAVARIDIASTPGRRGEVVVSVRDNGVGFDPQRAEKMFGVFQRLHSDSEFEGTGIGLATVRRIVTRHGGRVWAMGEVDKGATVYLTLVEARRDSSGV